MWTNDSRTFLDQWQLKDHELWSNQAQNGFSFTVASQFTSCSVFCKVISATKLTNDALEMIKFVAPPFAVTHLLRNTALYHLELCATLQRDRSLYVLHNHWEKLNLWASWSFSIRCCRLYGVMIPMLFRIFFGPKYTPRWLHNITMKSASARLYTEVLDTQHQADLKPVFELTRGLGCTIQLKQ